MGGRDPLIVISFPAGILGTIPINPTIGPSPAGCLYIKESAMTTRGATLWLVALLFATGCARVVVTKNPGPCDEGLRFYRPKAYLLVAPSEDNGISIELKYMPDYSEEYSVRMTPGLNATTSFKPTLSDGWNLTGFESETDQNVDELIKSVAGVLPSMKVAAAIPSDEGPKAKVPLGFYESVIVADERGCKRLLGWRYVGFFPNTCATGCCSTVPATDCATEPLWKLVWEKDGLVFEQE